MKNKTEKQKKAKKLRQLGESIVDISKKVGVSKSTISLWVREVKLTIQQTEKLNRKSCINRWNTISKEKEEYIKNPKKCINCESHISYRNRRQKYCRKKCYKIHKGIIDRQNSCIQCGEMKPKKENKFCSRECIQRYSWGKKIKLAIQTGHTNSTNQSTSKNLILKMRGHQCEMCKRNDWDGVPIPLVLDHINGRCKDWRLDNLQLVCGNCNMLLPTFVSKNKNSDRGKYRQDYYNIKK